MWKSLQSLMKVSSQDGASKGRMSYKFKKN